VPGEALPAEPAPAAASSAAGGPDTVEGVPVDATPVADANDPATDAAAATDAAPAQPTGAD